MKRVLIITMIALLMCPVWGVQVWQKNNKWLDINFISESEYAHSFIAESTFSEHFLTDNRLTFDINHFSFRMGLSDYRTKHYFEPHTDWDSLAYTQTSEMEAIYSDVSIYLQPRLKAIFSVSLSSINQPAPYYNKLATPVGRITLLRQIPMYYAFITIEGTYSTNLQKNESMNDSKSSPAKYVGVANHLTENTQFFDTPDVFDSSKHHYKAALNFYSNIKRGFSPLPDRTPLIYTPNSTFVLKSSYDYYIDESKETLVYNKKAHSQKLSVDANWRFWRVFELSGNAVAVDHKIDNTWVDNTDYDASASLSAYLYDFDAAKLIPTISYRHLEDYDNAQKQLIRLDKLITLTGYVCYKMNKNVLISGLVSEDLMLSHFRNEAFPETTRIDYDAHSHILNAAMGVTIWY